MRKLFVILSILILASLMVAAAPASRVCVFVPGVVSGSPIYEQLVSGAKRAVAEVPGASLKVVEGGFNQADWLGKLSALAATGEFFPYRILQCCDSRSLRPSRGFLSLCSFLRSRFVASRQQIDTHGSL